METIFNTIAPLILFASSLFGFEYTVPSSPVAQTVQSVEIGLSETSPRGEFGGYAVPASGCSALDPNWGNGQHPDTTGAPCPVNPGPTIIANPEIVRYGESVTITWNANNNPGCFLSSNIVSLPPQPVDTYAVAPNNKRVDILTGQETFEIRCWNQIIAGVPTAIFDQVTVKVLPRVQET